MSLRQVRRLAALFVCVVAASALLGAQAAETVFVTRTGSKYHRAGCSSLRSSSIPMPLEEASVKYQPCKICKPPVLEATAAATPTPASASSIATPTAAPRAKAVESDRCQATTKKGTQCSRKAKAGSRYCWQHGG